MNRFLILLATVTISIQAFSEEACEKSFPDDGARKIAISFLSRQENKNDYDGYPVSTIEKECFWQVSFKLKNSLEKNTLGTISIHKTTGEAKWLSTN